jgi:hypothetical protein
MGSDSHSAFLADTAFAVNKGKDPKDTKGLKPAGEKKEKDRHQRRTKVASYAESLGTRLPIEEDPDRSGCSSIGFKYRFK